MKRLILFAVTAALIFGNVAAQEPSTVVLLNHSTLKKKVEKSNEKIEHEKKKMKDKTWIQRGEIFQDVNNQGLEQLQIGIDKTTLQLFYTDPESVEQTDDGEILHYKTINYIFENGRLRGWTRNDPIVANPLDEALRSYKKAVELTDADKKMKTEEKIEDNLRELKRQFQREGQNKYFLGEYYQALDKFESVLDVTNSFAIFDGEVDTLMINYCGIVAREIAYNHKQAGEDEEAEKMYRKAIDYYDQLSDLNYGGSSNYVQMTRDFYAIGDTLGAIENLKKGLKQYPDSSLLVTVTAQAYYLMDMNEKGLEFVNQRIKEKPQDATAYYWKGLLITNEEDVEEETIEQALAYYDTSLMYDPTNSNVWYQSGYVNYAVGANYFEQESYEEDADLREDLNEKGVKYYEKAVEKLEKAYEMSVNDPTIRKESLDLLKRIYYKLYGSEDDRYISTDQRLKQL